MAVCEKCDGGRRVRESPYGSGHYVPTCSCDAASMPCPDCGPRPTVKEIAELLRKHKYDIVEGREDRTLTDIIQDAAGFIEERFKEA